MAVVLADILEAGHVSLDLQARSRDRALQEIVALMSGDGKIAEPPRFLAEVIAREEVHTTYMGRGVAFPHARTNLVGQIVLGIGRSQEGVLFGDDEETRAHLIFVIGVPQRMVTDYLVCVGALARVTKNAEMREGLLNATTSEEFVELLRSEALLLE